MQSKTSKGAISVIAALFCLQLFVCTSIAQSKAPGHKVTKGKLPAQCTDTDFSKGASADSENYGYYYSTKAKKWISHGWCYPRWGFLMASESQFVPPRTPVTVIATPTDGSNSAQYAPVTNTIQWRFPGKKVSGCGSADLTCTFV